MKMTDDLWESEVENELRALKLEQKLQRWERQIASMDEKTE